MRQHKRTFVIDTNVLIHRPDAFLSFRDSLVIIPLWVFEELDSLKRDHAGRGRSARQAIRHINEVSKRGSLQTGVKLPSGGTLQVGFAQSTDFPSDLRIEKTDNKIILCALAQMQSGGDVFFVSKDINARIKAAVLGIKAVDYEKNKVSMENLYGGVVESSIGETAAEDFRNSGRMVWEDRPLLPHQYVLLRQEKDGRKTVHIGRYCPGEGLLKYVQSWQEPVMGIKPLNVKQRAAFDLLLDDSVPLVTLVGKAGTGKTLLALAAGLRKTLEEKRYSRVLVSRPIIPMGADLGYLPGQKQAKMSHWMQPVFDNLEFIIDSAKQQNLKSIDQLLANKVMEIEAITYIRGRSLPRQYIIIDEGQNLTPHEVKTIVSRAGDSSKVVLTGDPYQIDSPYLDAESNGLTYLVEAFKNRELAGHVSLAKSERSPLAELAAELL